MAQKVIFDFNESTVNIFSAISVALVQNEKKQAEKKVKLIEIESDIKAGKTPESVGLVQAQKVADETAKYCKDNKKLVNARVKELTKAHNLYLSYIRTSTTGVTTGEGELKLTRTLKNGGIATVVYQNISGFNDTLGAMLVAFGCANVKELTTGKVAVQLESRINGYKSAKSVDNFMKLVNESKFNNNVIIAIISMGLEKGVLDLDKETGIITKHEF